MRTPKLATWTTLAALALTSSFARAEDIDIYQGTAGGAPPNLLIILDNAAAANANYGATSFTCSPLNLSSPRKNFDYEQCGLYNAVSAIGSSTDLKGNINLGLMYFPKGGQDGDGGIFVEPKPSPPPDKLLLMDDTGVKTMLGRIENLSSATDTNNNNAIAQAMQESWAFYNGQKGLSNTQYPGLGAAQACAKNFVLYITLATGNQKPQDSGNQAGLDLQKKANLTSLPTQLDLPPNWKSPEPPNKIAKTPSPYKDDYSDEWAKFMYTGTSPNLSTTYPSITTYTIVLTDGTNPEYEQLMASMANQGGGQYFMVKLGNMQALVDAIGKVFRDVQATNSVFAAPVLPVSTNTQGTYLNQVYIGMFRPDGTGNPRWTGNLKQYQFGVDLSDAQSPELFLADASWPDSTTGKYPGNTNANRALSAAGTGFISPTAVSFWTSKDTAKLPDKNGGFWSPSVMQALGAKDGFDSVDGNIVEKGGVGQQIRLKHLTETYTGASATTSRNLFTCGKTVPCAAGTALSNTTFSIGNQLLPADLGYQTANTASTNFINWVRGEDTVAREADGIAGKESSTPPASTAPDPSITVRGSVHGDVLHSRPVVINYGGSTGVVAFYGSNDGVFHAINGNQPNNTTDANKPRGFCTTSGTCEIASVPPGGELWGFIAPEFYSSLQKLYTNSPELTLGAKTSGKNYFFDGPTGVYQNAAAGKAYIFLTARRGGRLLYALDVSDPVNPNFMWKHTSADPGFGELGQTWSQPKVARVKGHSNPVLIFGAGYDLAEDDEPPSAKTMGRGVFVLDAVTGALLWQTVSASSTCATVSGATCVQTTGMDYAIPADITLVDRDFDGYIDRAYAADVGGNIWRIDFQPKGGDTVPDFSKTTWAVSQLAALGGSDATKRKMFFGPDVVLTKGYDVVVASTGDREHPLITHQANKVVNRFYMVKDMNVGMSVPTDSATVHDDTSSIADAAPPDLFNATSAEYDRTLKGYYITLSGAGEKAVNAPTTVGGKVYFGTNMPIPVSPTSCKANLGEARSYSVNFLTGKSSSVKFDGGGLLPSPVFGIVTVDVNGTPRQLPFLIGGGGSGADGKSGLGAQKPPIPIKVKKRRTFWYRDIDR